MLRKDLFVSFPGDFPWGFSWLPGRRAPPLCLRKALSSSKGNVSVLWIKISSNSGALGLYK